MAQFDRWLTQFNIHPDLAAKIATALFIAALTIFVSGLISGVVKRASRRFIHHEAARTLPEFFSQVVRWLILMVGFVAVLNKMGVPTTSLLAVLGAASLAIGLALQGSLSNVAASLVILFTKPFQIGDAVTLGELGGRVHRLGLFTTEIDDGDNRRVYIPNSKVFANEIINQSTNGAVRIEVIVDVAYESDLEKALSVIQAVLEAQPDLMRRHEPWVGLHQFKDSGIALRMMMWVPPSKGQNARSELMLAVKKALDAHGIEIPYPHQVAIGRDVADPKVTAEITGSTPPSP